MRSFKLFIFVLTILILIPNITLSTVPLTFYCTCYVPNTVSFNTSIANVALKVSALQGPCVEITSSGEYSNGSTFAVSKITSVEPLCYSDIAGVQDTRGSSVWFLSPLGWVWFMNWEEMQELMLTAKHKFDQDVGTLQNNKILVYVLAKKEEDEYPIFRKLLDHFIKNKELLYQGLKNEISRVIFNEKWITT
ncbi:33894_t:CDS:2 [Racocetra persica]|uniref:33894_t:CDS:1 n=1 Tax=Racocetra persica TaxID=160502 RepID=A0ACA9LHI1_9GLOM|nr:33894_t:CDS:2 [Racocetra persica]